MTGDQKAAVASFTRGPWFVGEISMIDRDTYDERPDPHNCYAHNFGSFEASILSENALADAHLIAAAPAMYEALESVVQADSEGHMMPKWLADAARAALSQARGEK